MTPLKDRVLEASRRVLELEAELVQAHAELEQLLESSGSRRKTPAKKKPSSSSSSRRRPGRPRKDGTEETEGTIASQIRALLEMNKGDWITGEDLKSALQLGSRRDQQTMYANLRHMVFKGVVEKGAEGWRMPAGSS